MDDSEIPDSELVCRAQVGDPTAQQLLIDRHKGLVFAVAKNNLGNRSDAEDVAQDTWTAFFMTSISRFDKNRPLRPFLLKICVHLASAYRRSRDRRSTVPIESYMVEDSSPPPGELLEQAERAANRPNNVGRCCNASVSPSDLPPSDRTPCVRRAIPS